MIILSEIKKILLWKLENVTKVNAEYTALKTLQMKKFT